MDFKNVRLIARQLKLSSKSWSTYVTGEANRVRAYKNYLYFLGMYDSGLEYGQIQHLHFSFEEKLNIGDTIDLRLYPDDWLYADSNHRISFSGELLYVE